MRLRPRLLLPALGVAVALVSGCSAGAQAAPRSIGDHVTDSEARALADLLHRDYQAGGADFTESADFAEGAVLTLTGSVDFVHKVGHAEAVTSFASGQPSEKRNVYFTDKELWYGDVPGLSAALDAAKLPQAGYIRRPLAVVKDGQPSLVDVMATMVLNLAAPHSDDPKAFTSGDYTWQGQRTVDGQLAAVYRLAGGTTVALGATDKELLQYVGTISGSDARVTISLPKHGTRSIQLPTDAQTLDASAHPEIATQVGV